MEDNIPTTALHALARQIPPLDTASVKIYEKAYRWTLVIDAKFIPKWVRNITLVQIDRAVFSKGLVKSSYKMRDVTQSDIVFIAKFGVHSYLTRNMFFSTAIIHSICAQFAEKFNSLGDFPIKLKFQHVFVLELVEKMHPHNVCTGEHFVDGEYKERNVTTDTNDPEFKVFQAFNHFVMVKTNYEFCLSHFQIVQNIVTSAVIHTKSGKGFSEQNQGQPEFLRFSETHVCNEFCKQLQLAAIDVEKIKEAPALPRMPNGVVIRKTVAAAATEKLTGNTGQASSFVSQKRAVFLQNQAATPIPGNHLSTPNAPSPDLRDSSNSSPAPSPTPYSVPASTTPATSSSTLAASPAVTPSAPTTAPAAAVLSPPGTPILSPNLPSATPPTPATAPITTPPTPRRFSASTPKSPQLGGTTSKPVPDIKQSESKTAAEPKPKPEPKTTPESKVESKAEVKPESKVEVKQEPKVETKTEHKQDHKPEPKQEPKKEGDIKSPKVEPKPGAKPEVKLELKKPEAGKPASPLIDAKLTLRDAASPAASPALAPASTPAKPNETLLSPRQQPSPAAEVHAPAQAAPSRTAPASVHAQAPAQAHSFASASAPAPASQVLDLTKIFSPPLQPVFSPPQSHSIIPDDEEQYTLAEAPYEEISIERIDEIEDFDYSDDDYYSEEEEAPPLPPLPDKSPYPPNLRKLDHTYAKKTFRVRWLDLLDFEKNLLPVQQARKGLGEGIVVLIPELDKPKVEQKTWDLKSFRINTEAKGAQAECITGDDNPFLYTGSSEGYVAVWDVQALKVTTSFKTHSKAVKSLVLRDAVLYTGSTDTNIASWDINYKKSINKTSSKAEINALAISVAHNLLFSAENDKTIKVWDLHSLQYITTLNGHTRAVKALYVLGNYLFSGSNDQQVFVWNLNTQRVVKGLLGHEGWIRSIHAMGSTLYTGSQDETIRLWDLNSTECFQVIQAKGPVQSLTPTPQCLFSAAGDYIEVWNNDFQSANVLNNRAPVLCMWNKDQQLFCGSIASSLKAAPAFTAEEIESFKDTFNIFDKDKSGSIDKKELETVLKNLGRETSAEKIEALMLRVDADGSGEISFDEFLALMASMQEEDQLRVTFAEFDKDGSGFITREELQEAMKKVDPDATPADIDNMLLEADTDGNNQIDFEEFCKIMK